MDPNVSNLTSAQVTGIEPSLVGAEASPTTGGLNGRTVTQVSLDSNPSLQGASAEMQKTAKKTDEAWWKNTDNLLKIGGAIAIGAGVVIGGATIITGIAVAATFTGGVAGIAAVVAAVAVGTFIGATLTMGGTAALLMGISPKENEKTNDAATNSGSPSTSVAPGQPLQNPTIKEPDDDEEKTTSEQSPVAIDNVPEHTQPLPPEENIAQQPPTEKVIYDFGDAIKEDDEEDNTITPPPKTSTPATSGKVIYDFGKAESEEEINPTAPENQ